MVKHILAWILLVAGATLAAAQFTQPGRCSIGDAGFCAGKKVSGGTPVTFDNGGTIQISATNTTVDYTGITTTGAATEIIAMVSDGNGETLSSVVWDPSGVNQSFTQIGSTQALGASLQISAWGLHSPSSSGNKTIRYSYSSFGGGNAGFYAASFIGASGAAVGASCGQGQSAGSVNTETDTAIVAANHMGLIQQRGGFFVSNNASWTPTPDQSLDASSAARTAYLHGTGTFSLQITFDGANTDPVGHICMDVSP